MAAGTLPITLEQGATFRLSFIYGTRGPDDVDGNPTMGTPYDLTGCTARMQIRQRYGSPVLIDLEDVLTSAEAGIMLGGVTGEISIHISDEQTEPLTIKKGKYDLKIFYPSGDEKRVLQGDVTVSKATTLEDTP
jgi:hypothetical protein